ncbi:MAG: hypothetical protein M1399_09630 [Actinobacteria bacterium]|nr:hypothetical protein [Actinomycetota bacterium]MCL5447377.1 hypothetical protein [Actinomycetota bacterium]
MASIGELIELLRGASERLSDEAFDRLRAASSDVAAGGSPDGLLLAEEKSITRARRAVERAIAALESVPHSIA